MRHAMRWIVLTSVLLLMASSSLGCVTTRPRAQAIVDVIAEPGIRADARSLLVTVRGGPSAGPLVARLSEVVEAPLVFPVSLTIVPEGDDASRVFEVEVVALDGGGGRIGVQSVRGRFLERTTTYAQLVLEDCCRRVAPTCGRDETCTACECMPLVIVDPNDDAGVVPLDAAMLDAGPLPDANLGAVDVGIDASGCTMASECPVMPCSTVECLSGRCEYTSLCGGDQVCCAGECASNCDCLEQRGGTVCRAATEPCDVAETCNGLSPVCPPDVVQGAGAIACRAAASPCDLEERCDGLSRACPADQFRPVGATCPTGTCNGVGTCSSTCTAGAVCPVTDMPCATGTITCPGGVPTCTASAPAAAGIVCRPSAGLCDVAESCNGTSMVCPADAFRASGTCREANGSCDVAETCNGSGAACPTDGRVAPGTICRAAADECDRAETCDGSNNACPTDGFLSLGTACGLGLDPDCSQSACTGESPECPSTNGQPCRCEGTCMFGTCRYGCVGGGGIMCCEATGLCSFWSSGDCPVM